MAACPSTCRYAWAHVSNVSFMALSFSHFLFFPLTCPSHALFLAPHIPFLLALCHFLSGPRIPSSPSIFFTLLFCVSIEMVHCPLECKTQKVLKISSAIIFHPSLRPCPSPLAFLYPSTSPKTISPPPLSYFSICSFLCQWTDFFLSRSTARLGDIVSWPRQAKPFSVPDI